jgi:hypothetical protein
VSDFVTISNKCANTLTGQDQRIALVGGCRSTAGSTRVRFAHLVGVPTAVRKVPQQAFQSVVDTDWSVFGNVTPVKWRQPKGDDCLRCFLFTLRSPHGVPPRKFALMKEKKEKAFEGHHRAGVLFGSGCDLQVSNSCNANRVSYTRTGTRSGSDTTYANDTDLKFIFEMTDETRLHIISNLSKNSMSSINSMRTDQTSSISFHVVEYFNQFTSGAIAQSLQAVQAVQRGQR